MGFRRRRSHHLEKKGAEMANILIIGAGGVGSVATHKCAQAAKKSGVFESITLASRTLSRCEDVARSVRARLGVDIDTARVDADNVPELCDLIRQVKPDLVCNLALPYQDLHIMDACLGMRRALHGYGQL